MNRAMLILAAAIVIAGALIGGAVIVAGPEEDASPRGVTGPSPASPSPAMSSPIPEEPSTPEDTVRLLLVAWRQDDAQAALEFATPAAIEALFREPRRYRDEFLLRECSEYLGEYNCSLVFSRDDRVSFNLHVIQSGDSSFLVEYAEMFVL